MRVYQDKKNIQKKSFHSDRFYVTPTLPRDSVYDDATFSNDYLSISKKIEITEAFLELDHLVMWINPEDNVAAIKYAKEILAYDLLVELSAIDYIADKGGFEIFYEMLSTTKRKRLRFKTFIKQGQAIESVNPLFRCADWSEREMYDMFGIVANNHPYMKRILMPDDWHDHPLLKTYPLHGDEAAQWYEVDKIFGKDARDVIGPEERDDAAIDRYDSTRFARLGHEVPFGAPVSAETEAKNEIRYQEDGGVHLGAGPKLVQPFDEIETKNLEERK
jgi:NADH-quinone oxidoreductase subunit C